MSDTAQRWIVTIIFGVSIALIAYSLVPQNDRWIRIVNHVLHLVMSAAMISMAWPIGRNLPTVGPMIVFLLAAVWFIHLATRANCATRRRLTNCYNAVMMAAMSWMYAVMNNHLPGQTGDHSPNHAMSGPLAMTASTEMPTQQMSPTTPEIGWITTVNWIATLGFAVAAVYWLCRYVAEHRTHLRPHTTRPAHVELLSQAFAAAGTAVVFGAML